MRAIHHSLLALLALCLVSHAGLAADQRIILVNRLDDNVSNPAPGMLRWALEQPGQRRVEFAVSGDIRLKDRIKIEHGDLEIDGRTAPDLGVCVRGGSLEFDGANNIAISYIRVRLGDETVRARLKKEKRKRPRNSAALDCIALSNCRNVVVEHCSLSWSCDELLSVIRCHNVTVRDCILSEPLGDPRLHPYGDLHAYPLLASASTLVVERCLFAHYVMRGPQFEANDLRKEDKFIVRMTARDNVMFDYKRSGARYTAGVEDHKKDAEGASFIFKFEDNLFVSEPTKYGPVERVDKHGYHSGVQVTQKDNVSLTELDSMSRKPWLASVGCSHRRDAADHRVLRNLENSRMKHILDSQNDVGGWPALDGRGDSSPTRLLFGKTP